MSKLFNNTTSLNEILEAIQNKAAGSGGTDTSDATATAATILSGYTAYVKGEKITGTIETKTFSDLTSSDARVTIPAGYYASTISKSVSTATQATPSITVSSSGLITASAKQTAGYVTAGTKNATKQLTTKAATTYTPGTSNQTIAASTYLTGIQTIKGDSNLVAGNIKSGTSIFGVTGTYEGSSSEIWDGSFSGEISVLDGYKITFDLFDVSEQNYVFYSLDNGNTWHDFCDLYSSTTGSVKTTLENVKTIKFKVNSRSDTCLCGRIVVNNFADSIFSSSTSFVSISTTAGLSCENDDSKETENFILTADVENDIQVMIYFWD